jgi:hypothetical protein
MQETFHTITPAPDHTKNVFMIIGLILLAVVVGAVVYVRIQQTAYKPVTTGPTPEQQAAFLKAIADMHSQGKIVEPTPKEQQAFLAAVNKQQTSPTAPPGPTDAQKQAFINAINKQK